MKKIFIFLVLLLSFWNIFAEWEKNTLKTVQDVHIINTQVYNDAKANLNEKQQHYDSIDPDGQFWREKREKAKVELNKAQESYDKVEGGYQKSQEDLDEARESYLNSDEAKEDITTQSFEIPVSTFTPGTTKLEWKTTSEKTNFVLWKIIETMMLAIWILSILIMTVGWWFIILHNWQDELLNKWKSIFMSGVYAMVIALGSYILVSIVGYILYASN